MSSIKPLDLRLVDALFEPEGKPGYVLDFTDRTFAAFFRQEMRLDINDPKYAVEGTSKGKRLRYFLKTVDDSTAAKLLRALWEYRSGIQRLAGHVETVQNAKQQLAELVERLSPQQKPAPQTRAARPKAAAEHNIRLAADLIALTAMAPHPRGYAFEKFLKDVFAAHEMDPRASFRNRGEQIDGSFTLDGHTYLFEAKWQKDPIDAPELHAFNGKVAEKTAFTRGLYISHGLFSADGLHAFGKGKRLVCMDGLDLYDTLRRHLSFGDVVAEKWRKADETGNPFVRVRDIFPE